MVDIERKLEQGDWGSLWLERAVYKYGGYQPPWKMITDRRELWWGSQNAYHHPDSPLKRIDGCVQNPSYIVCPYCGHEHDPETEDYFLEGDEAECYECEKKYVVDSDFGYGFSAEPKPCKHHHFVFSTQYAYCDDDEWSTWRNMVCINCGKINNCKTPMSKIEKVNGFIKLVPSKQPIYTLMPWLDEYNDPDFFDPEGTLKTGADLAEEYETPILDFLRDRSGNAWKYDWHGHGANHAVYLHEKVYGAL